uniref:Isp1 n=1 Tax=Arundo donax TaxID=35708 RepID=A0A0A9CWR4_ARUDO
MHACWGHQAGSARDCTHHRQFLQWDSSRLPQLLGAQLSLHPGFLEQEFQQQNLCWRRRRGSRWRSAACGRVRSRRHRGGGRRRAGPGCRRRRGARRGRTRGACPRP